MRAAWLALVLCACGPPDRQRERNERGPDDPSTTFSQTGIAPTLAVGDGATQHEPCLPGDETTLWFGGQGGFHLDVSADVQGLGQMVGVWVEARRLDTGEPIASNGVDPSYLLLGDYSGVEDTGWFAGQRAFIFNNALVEVCPLDGLALELCATAFDLNDAGSPVTDCVELVARLHPDDLPMCGG